MGDNLLPSGQNIPKSWQAEFEIICEIWEKGLSNLSLRFIMFH